MRLSRMPSSTVPRSLRRTAGVALVASVVLFTACGEADNGESAPAAAPPVVQIGQENVVRVTRGTIVVGPMIAGELRAQQEATVRAEIGGSMLAVAVEEGQAVRKGALLGRIDARTLGDTQRSAQSAVRSAEIALEVARSEAARTEELVKAGAIAQRELDLSRTNVTAAEAQVADARARLASATAELGDAVIRAPISGIVADRAVNTGDVVSPGTALFTIIDPSSMRLEAAVPSDDLSALRIGAVVQFRVRGYAEPFEGRIERIAPRADPVTRQVPIFVTIPNVGGRLLAGLFAEGRVISESATGLVVPNNAVNISGATPWVMRVAGGKTERVEVALGLRDGRMEQVQVVSGLDEGDVLLRGAAQGITPGTPVQVGGGQQAVGE
jgi:RND family efflux transporter MFP subunit